MSSENKSQEETAVTILYLSAQFVRDSCLRCKVEDTPTMAKAVRKTAFELYPVYEELLSCIKSGSFENPLQLPIIHDMGEKELKELKTTLSQAVSDIDTKLSE